MRRVLPLPGFRVAEKASQREKNGVAGRAAAKRAIAPSTSPHACPQQGRRRPAPKFCAGGAGGVTTVETCVGAAA